jgi:haloacid dehalogenase-like hydrolase
MSEPDTSEAPSGDLASPAESRVAPAPRTFRAVALDIDGTLLTPEGHVAPRTAAAVREALARGVLVVLCTGREYSHGVNRLASELRLHLPAIVRNGAVVQDIADGRVLSQKFLPAEALRLTLEAIATIGASPMVIQGPREGDAICTLPPEQCHPAVAFYGQLWIRENTFRRVSSVRELFAMSSTTWVSGAGDKGCTEALDACGGKAKASVTVNKLSRDLGYTGRVSFD